MQLSPDQNLNKSAGKENASFIQIDFNPLYTGNPQTCTLANSEDPDEKFHQGLHCLLGLKKKSFMERSTSYFRKFYLQKCRICCLEHSSVSWCLFGHTQWALQYIMYQYVWENPSVYKEF